MHAGVSLAHALLRGSRSWRIALTEELQPRPYLSQVRLRRHNCQKALRKSTAMRGTRALRSLGSMTKARLGSGHENKGKVGLIFAKTAALCIDINTDGSPVAIARTHATHGSHAPRLNPFLITSSLFVLVPKCTRGHLIQSQLSRAPCSTLFVLLSHIVPPLRGPKL